MQDDLVAASHDVGSPLSALYYPFSRCVDACALKQLLLIFDSVTFIEPVDDIVSQSSVGSMAGSRRVWIWVTAAGLLIIVGVVGLFVSQSDREPRVVQQGAIHSPAEQPEGGATTKSGNASSPSTTTTCGPR